MEQFTAHFEHIIEWAVLGIEAVSAIMIALAVFFGVLELARSVFRGDIKDEMTPVRLKLAERFVLALEFLIAADILKTVVTPTLDGMAVLGGVIIIRTVLSLSIDYELRRDKQGPDKRDN